uniref:Uncharacterized protein n=1 Tax=Oryzias melastigma TaxID=30732 RepID=A0A3B3DCM7_ORYME
CDTMRKIDYLVCLFFILFNQKTGSEYIMYCDKDKKSRAVVIHKYHAKTLNGSHTVNFSDYAGKSVLFVNVATY